MERKQVLSSYQLGESYTINSVTTSHFLRAVTTIEEGERIHSVEIQRSEVGERSLHRPLFEIPCPNEACALSLLEGMLLSIRTYSTLSLTEAPSLSYQISCD